MLRKTRLTDELTIDFPGLGSRSGPRFIALTSGRFAPAVHSLGRLGFACFALVAIDHSSITDCLGNV